MEAHRRHLRGARDVAASSKEPGVARPRRDPNRHRPRVAVRPMRAFRRRDRNARGIRTGAAPRPRRRVPRRRRVFQSRDKRDARRTRGGARARGRDARAGAGPAAAVPTHASRAIVRAPGPRVGASQARDPRPPAVVHDLRDKRRDGGLDERLVSQGRRRTNADKPRHAHDVARRRRAHRVELARRGRGTNALAVHRARGKPAGRRVHESDAGEHRAPRGGAHRVGAIADALRLGAGAGVPGVSKGASGGGGRVHRGARAHAQASGGDGEDGGR
mmetsp:Transcript_1580/g.6178  ORF Transcript_1580/g.6178 Transcript_1580/m.6178 type:complete len:274 (+) Transcript_1580:573-1394(+)